MSTQHDARPEDKTRAVSLDPTEPAEAATFAAGLPPAPHGRPAVAMPSGAAPTACPWRAQVKALSLAGLVSGLFWPWLGSKYFQAGPVSVGLFDLPGGRLYAAALTLFALTTLSGGPRSRAGRAAWAALAAALATFSAFWLLGGLAMALQETPPLSELSFPLGAVLSLTGSVLGWLMARTGGHQPNMTGPGDPTSDLILPSGPDNRPSEFSSSQALLESLEYRPNGVGHEPALLLLVRLEGLDDVRRRHGGAAAEQLSVMLSHRARANVRRDDTVVRFLPTQLLIFLSGQVLEENAMVVVRRLEAALAKPVPSARKRHAKLVTPTVHLVRGTVTNGHLHLLPAGPEPSAAALSDPGKGLGEG